MSPISLVGGGVRVLVTSPMVCLTALALSLVVGLPVKKEPVMSVIPGNSLP